MKRLLILVCILTMLLALAGVASASPAQPQKFRIKGYTTSASIDQWDPFMVSVTSEGKVIQHIQGTFTMDEDLFNFVYVYGKPIPKSNSGTLTITTKKGDTVVIGFAGSISATTVSGDFWVISGTDAYAGLTGGGIYTGIPDDCESFSPVLSGCPGFYVDFTFAH